ncbi:F0F1 ATP synthase subunit A [Nemorincola caseinilytica]|uniref:F0F1 ATP synthase subunit A n=1 Tax=Nemorincola caseinilytica TaxID=2054315 RepID=UPI0031EB01CF
MFGHVGDSHEWHLFSLEGEHGHETEVAMPLPVITYRPKTGEFSMFSYSRFHGGWYLDEFGNHISNTSYDGLYVEKNMKEKIRADNGDPVYDLSITKNVLSMMISVVIILLLMTSAAKKYKTASLQAPKGFQNALESAIIFIRDEVARPNLGPKYLKFMPLLLTVFFFIWVNNLLGLLPGGANFTGNIAVTLCLSIVSFIVMVVKANKHFWGHLLNPPGVPTGIKFLLVPIEIISLFIKPIALTIRLFANILAGHIVILCVISMIFIFGALSKGIGIGFVPVSLAFGVFMFMLELLVAAIQAFIFTNLTAVFIGQAVEEGHGHGDEAHGHEAHGAAHH